MPRWFKHRATAQTYFCVVGNPVAHSRSPAIHSAFAAQLGRSLVYERIEVAPGQLAAAVAEFRDCGGRGMNITVPLKEEAWQLADRREARAATAGAANTLWFEDAAQTVVVDNTDGIGLVRDLENNLALSLADKTVLLIGAGGAARGVAPALCDAKVGLLQLTNRTAAKATALAGALVGETEIEVVPWGENSLVRPDLLINATSLSLSGEVPPLGDAMLSAESVCYDMMYSREPTAFMAWANAQGAQRTVDGLGMLVEQAAEAFFLWHGEYPSTTPVIAALRQR